jgi:hypothetical protein
MSNIGIKNATTRKMISETVWYLGASSSQSGLYPNDIYNYERTNKVGTTIYRDNPFIITASIGLMYASDYGYGTDLTKCSKDISYYNNDANSYACSKNNWLFNLKDQWLIAPSSSVSYYAWHVLPSGSVFDNLDYRATSGVRPVLYLNSELTVGSGHAGTSTDPYRISVN